ncbi:hypothetical protein LSAT2_027338 [Lamellibrachia satsuma]|nr:hypothetical protein LSAT2_027338 [Lamellibrachia satsuma]
MKAPPVGPKEPRLERTRLSPIAALVTPGVRCLCLGVPSPVLIVKISEVASIIANSVRPRPDSHTAVHVDVKNRRANHDREQRTTKTSRTPTDGATHRVACACARVPRQP